MTPTDERFKEVVEALRRSNEALLELIGKAFFEKDVLLGSGFTEAWQKGEDALAKVDANSEEEQ